ncbi:MAG: cellulase family glycosylhydrolase [Anaerolineae bacterium]
MSEGSGLGRRELGIIGCALGVMLLTGMVVCAGAFAALLGVYSFAEQSSVAQMAATAKPQPSIVLLTPEITPSPTIPPPPTSTPFPTDTPLPTPTVEPTAPPPTDTPLPPTDTPLPPNPPPAAHQSNPLRMNSPEYGMQAFLWWRPETADRDLKLIRDAGFGWVKQVFSWREIEGAAKGHLDWSYSDRIVDQVEQHGLNLIARIDSQPQWAGGGYPENGPPDNLQDFADFLYTFVSRYKGRIRAYQVWNEPNLNVPGRSEWGGRPPNPAEYTEMLKVAYQAIKSADPNAMVISAGLSPTSRWDNVAMPDEEFLKGMYASGAKPYFDVLGAHGAGYKVPPETDPSVVANDPVLHNYDPSPPERKRIYCFRHVEDLRRIMVENGDADKQIILLEFGWTSDPRPDSPYAWHAVSEREKADYLVRAYQYAKQNWAPWMGVMSLIYVCNPDWREDREEFWWSITTYQGWPQHAYYALQEMPK